MRFTYDLNGILEVDCTVVTTGKTASLIVEDQDDTVIQLLRERRIAATRTKGR